MSCSPADGTPKITDFGLAKFAGQRLGPDADRRDPGLAQLHGARAGRGQGQGGRARGRRLRAGGDPLRAAHRPPAVPGGDGPGDARAGQDRRAGAAVAAGAAAAARPGDDLPEVPAERAGAALRVGRGPGRRPAPLPATASRSWRGRIGGAGTGLAVVPPQPGRRRAGGPRRGGAPGRHSRTRPTLPSERLGASSSPSARHARHWKMPSAPRKRRRKLERKRISAITASTWHK